MVFRKQPSKKSIVTIVPLLSILICATTIASVVRIMPLGDSITYDNNMGDTRPIGERIAYRFTLHNLLISADYAFDFIGSENGGNNYLSAEMDDNAGFPGITDSQIAALIGTGFSPRHNSQITPGPYLETYPADVILLHIGTNGIDPDPNDVEDILDNIRTSDPNVIIFVARIIDFYPHNEVVTIFNDNVEAMVAARADSRIIMVDMEDGAGIDYAFDMTDRLHPNIAGYDKMGKLWFEHLTIIFEPHKAYLPYPMNESYQWPPEFPGFLWSIPEPRHPNDVVACNVYIGTDPNELELIAADEPNDFLLSDVYPIIPETNYYWRVDCIDPNAGNPVITEGRLWNFHTFDPAPKVNAGEDLFGRLPSRGFKIVHLEIDALVADQGDPKALYYLWSIESAPADAPDVIFNDNTIEDPVVSFSATGEYILRLSASDEGPVENQEPNDIGTDTVTIKIR